jgi:hypothetical protein
VLSYDTCSAALTPPYTQAVVLLENIYKMEVLIAAKEIAKLGYAVKTLAINSSSFQMF